MLKCGSYGHLQGHHCSSGDVQSDASFDQCVCTSIPCVSRGRVAGWPCVSARDHGASLLGSVGDCQAPVALGGTYDATRSTMRVRDFMARPVSPSVQPPYLKDFHLCRELAVLNTALPYSVPAPLADDLLNGFFDALAKDAPLSDAAAGLQSRAGDDFRFLYAGPPGSWTPVHHDVLYSASWSANVTGWKVWVLVEPGAARTALYRGGSPQGDLVVDSLFTPAEAAIVEEVAAAVGGDAWAGGRIAGCAVTQPLPAALEALGARAVCVQGPGDVVFVPGGWRAWQRGRASCLFVH